MAIKGRFCLEGAKEDYNVVECQYKLMQQVNKSTGIPISGLDATPLSVTIVTPPSGQVLYEWMIDEFAFKNGYIELITNVNSNTKAFRYLIFENAKCVALLDYFNNQNSSMMVTRLKIQPSRMYFADDSLEGCEAFGYDFRNKRKAILNFSNEDAVHGGIMGRRKSLETAYINSWNV